MASLLLLRPNRVLCLLLFACDVVVVKRGKQAQFLPVCLLACLLVCLSWNMIDCGARLPINQSINEPTTRAFLALLNLKDFERKEQVRPDSSFLLRLNRNNVATGSICCHGRMASTYNRHRKGSTDPTKTNNCRLSPLGFLIHFYALSRQSTTHAKKRSW